MTAAELAVVLAPPAAPAPAAAARGAPDTVYERALPWCCALLVTAGA